MKKQLDIKGTGKKVGKIFIELLLITLIVYVSNVIQNYNQRRTYVEPYCSNKYQNSVNEYKSCKKLTPVQILQTLKEEPQTEVPNLPLIKI